MNFNRQDYPMVNLSSSLTCQSCHPKALCLSCHQVQLPHAADWISGGHALEGFVNKKLCLECHDQASCQKCHSGSTPHDEDWVKGHAQEAKVMQTWCTNCHQSDFCLICHSDTTVYKLKNQLPQPKTKFKPHPENWMPQHGRQARQQLQDCLNCHRTSFCLRCHEDLKDFKMGGKL
jgi:hypothetical protein